MNLFLDANICLDLLDSTRPNSSRVIEWYLAHKNDEHMQFYFSSDFITTIYYILTERRKLPAVRVIEALEIFSFEIVPFYLEHSDFVEAKNAFRNNMLSDFEDLMILHSASRAACDLFVTSDNELLALKQFGEMKIVGVEGL